MPDGYSEELTGRAGDALIGEAHAAFERAAAHPSAAGLPAGPQQEARRMFELAVVEVLANIAGHSPAGQAVQVTVRLTAQEGVWRARIQDDAPPASVDLEAATMPDALAESGRGLALVRGIVDRFQHAAGAGSEPGNVWTLELAAPRGE